MTEMTRIDTYRRQKRMTERTLWSDRKSPVDTVRKGRTYSISKAFSKITPFSISLSEQSDSRNPGNDLLYVCVSVEDLTRDGETA